MDWDAPASTELITRSGGRYSRRVLTPIACPPSFHITPLLRAALDAELDALPDIPLWEREDAEDDVPELVENPSVLSPADAPLTTPPSSLLSPYTPPRGENQEKRPQQVPDNKHGALPAKRSRIDTASEVRAPIGAVSQAPAPSGSSGRTGNRNTHRNKGRKRAHRRNKKDTEFQQQGQAARPPDLRKHTQSSTAVPANLALDDLPANSSGYEARPRNPNQKKRALDFDELKTQEGWKVVKWDGTDSKVLYDEETRKIWVACVGKPPDRTWDPACQLAAHVIRSIGEKELFASRELDHKRGDFPVINAGILFGGGPEKPYNLLNRKHADALAKLFRDENVIRLATFQSASLGFFAPNLYKYKHERIQALLRHMPSLKPNFMRSVFSACAFNFGPQVVTFPHTDCMNLAFGWCAVTALGDYDYTKGGHLVLVEAQLIIEFPPGATILLPSATVTHANTPVQPGETRLSFTQYTSGPLFRYVDNGFRTKGQFEEQDPKGYAAMMEENATRWKLGLGLWDTLDDLLSRANCEREEGELDSDEDVA